MARQNLRPSNETIVIGLLNVPRLEEKREESVLSKPPPKTQKATPLKPVAKQEITVLKPREPVAEPEQAKIEEAHPTKQKEPDPIVGSLFPGQGGGTTDQRRGETGIGEASSGAPFVAGGGGGAADIAAIQKGSGSSGSGTATKGSREARPLQTVRASYPPMALRMGIEADVVLKVQVDANGKVIKAELIKSGGMGFDEEALRAVRQFRFEPAKKDGVNIPSEFTYIYRFRLEK